MFTFEASRTRRKPALTPMIDVVFLLMVFFMLAAQFGRDGALSLAGSAGASQYNGPPRLITVLPDGIQVNGFATTQEDMLTRLSDLTDTKDDAIILRVDALTDVQRLTDIAVLLSEAGYTRLIVAE